MSEPETISDGSRTPKHDPLVHIVWQLAVPRDAPALVVLVDELSVRIDMRRLLLESAARLSLFDRAHLGGLDERAAGLELAVAAALVWLKNTLHLASVRVHDVLLDVAVEPSRRSSAPSTLSSPPAQLTFGGKYDTEDLREASLHDSTVVAVLRGSGGRAARPQSRGR